VILAGYGARTLYKYDTKILKLEIDSVTVWYSLRLGCCRSR